MKTFRDNSALRSEIPAVRELLEAAANVLVVTHVGPDGDAMGSLTAVGVALQQMNKSFTLACDDGALSRFNYLALSSEIVSRLPDTAQYDLIIALDCGDESRMGQIFAVLPDPKAPVINIDHHVTNTRFGQVNIVDSDSTSTAEMLFYLLPELGVEITTRLATSLLTGVVTDTLGFRTSGVTASTLHVASELMATGADLATVTAHGLLIQPMSTLLLWRAGLNNMKLEEEGLLWTAVSYEERQQISHTSSSSGGLVNMLSNIDGVAVGAVLLEDDGKVFVGFRSRPPFNVAQLALNLGGGGHPQAAGCMLEGSLADAVSLVVSLARESIRQQRSML